MDKACWKGVAVLLTLACDALFLGWFSYRLVHAAHAQGALRSVLPVSAVFTVILSSAVSSALVASQLRYWVNKVPRG